MQGAGRLANAAAHSHLFTLFISREFNIFSNYFCYFFSVHPHALSVDANAILFVVVVPIVVSLALSISFLFEVRE